MDKIILDAIELGCLKNAVKFNGKCNQKAIIGVIIGQFPEIKENMKELVKEINKIAEKVNSFNIEKQKKELLAHDSHALDKKPKQERKLELKELANVDKKKGVVMRFAPSPSGPMHIGHVFSGMPTSIYVERYGGKFILRIEDTNPENIYEPAYKLLPKDAKWIFGNVTDVWIQSDRIKTYYDYAERLISSGDAYVCTCDDEKFKELIKNRETCPCRSLNKEKNLDRWKKMLDKKGFKQGEVVLRFKSDISHKNPALRDFPLARINETEHPRQGKKFRVWPLMNLCVTVDDIEAGMTHVIRAKEHQTNAERQKLMYKALGVEKFPQTMFLGRWNFEGLEISCSKTKARIDSGEFTGWDDIRVPFLLALKRRGYQVQAFKKFVLNVGVTSADKKMQAEEFFKVLNAFNKDIIDPTSKRFFFIENPVKVRIKYCPDEDIELDLHPDNIKGGRKFKINERFLLDSKDIEKLKDNVLIRLMDCINFRKIGKEYVFASLDYEVFKKQNGKQIIYWLVDNDELINVEVLMPDNKLIKGRAESALEQIKVGEVIQFERFGFCRLDSIDSGICKFWFTHR